MNNYKRLKKEFVRMTVEDLAEILSCRTIDKFFDVGLVCKDGVYTDKTCIDCKREFLEREVTK